jgi:hypothetical protein
MKTTIIIFLILTFCVQTLFSQRIILSNKADLYFSFGIVKPLGAKDYGNSAALLGNMKSNTSIDVTYAQHLYKPVYFGVLASYSKFNSWSHGNIHTFDGTTTTILGTGPVLGLKSQPTQLYGLKTVVLNASVSPMINIISTKTSPGATINDTDPNIPLTVSSSRFGVEVRGGAECFITNAIGATFGIGYRNIAAKSQIFPEKQFSFLTFRVGVFYRLMKNKKYRYSDL